MKNFLFILSIFIATGCGEDNTINYNLKTIEIRFAKAKMDIPNSYIKSSPDELIEEVKRSDLPEPIVKSRIQFYETIKSYKLKSLVFTDTTNIGNKIMIQEGEHVMLTKKISQLYAGKLEQELEKNWLTQGVGYKRIEIKFSKGGTTQLVKLKYNIIFGDYSNYTTQYIITTLKKTLAITVTSTSKEDYEDLIKGMKI
ncbi:MAG: hypothetical protein COB15_05630 [Flavobacteriales bacterium]|nr:MAG: hypothetical protein COB15_05630 [Flavobacteriales bacterium]